MRVFRLQHYNPDTVPCVWVLRIDRRTFVTVQLLGYSCALVPIENPYLFSSYISHRNPDTSTLKPTDRYHTSSPHSTYTTLPTTHSLLSPCYSLSSLSITYHHGANQETDKRKGGQGTIGKFAEAVVTPARGENFQHGEETQKTPSQAGKDCSS